ncbi:unnamed protein product [Mesocestoides corti]|uniref:Uncharacterized protein n=1 Tax=Mesocestoides corti TaxID=53468 RepID=A0A0R3U299_MESCO|nr:unnamed protein product [Mesocestoides corti]
MTCGYSCNLCQWLLKVPPHEALKSTAKENDVKMFRKLRQPHRPRGSELPIGRSMRDYWVSARVVIYVEICLIGACEGVIHNIVAPPSRNRNGFGCLKFSSIVVFPSWRETRRLHHRVKPTAHLSIGLRQRLVWDTTRQAASLAEMSGRVGLASVPPLRGRACVGTCACTPGGRRSPRDPSPVIYRLIPAPHDSSQSRSPWQTSCVSLGSTRVNVIGLFLPSATLGGDFNSKVIRCGCLGDLETGGCFDAVFRKIYTLTSLATCPVFFANTNASHWLSVAMDLSGIQSPHLSFDDITENVEATSPGPPRSSVATDDAHQPPPLPSIPQGRELIIPVNGPPCCIQSIEAFSESTTNVFSDFARRQAAKIDNDAFGGSVEVITTRIRERITIVMEQQEAPTSRPSRSSANRADAFAMDNRKREATSRSSASSSTSSSSATTSTTTSSKRPSLSEAVTPPDSGVGSSARSPENLPPASTRNPPSLKPPGFFGRLRLFSLSNASRSPQTQASASSNAKLLGAVWFPSVALVVSAIDDCDVNLCGCTEDNLVKSTNRLINVGLASGYGLNFIRHERLAVAPRDLKITPFFDSFGFNQDRPRSNADNPRAASSLSVHEPQHCSPDDLNPHLLPKSRHAVSSRLEFTGKSILSGKYSKLMDLPKPRTRRLSGHYRGGDAGPPLSPNDVEFQVGLIGAACVSACDPAAIVRFIASSVAHFLHHMMTPDRAGTPIVTLATRAPPASQPGDPWRESVVCRRHIHKKIGVNAVTTRGVRECARAPNELGACTAARCDWLTSLEVCTCAGTCKIRRHFGAARNSPPHNATVSMSRSVRFALDALGAYAPDFARSCPDRDSMTCLGLMGELMSAVDILSARQNQWCSSGDAKNTIQVLKAAQSSTLLFVRKSVDEPVESLEAKLIPWMAISVRMDTCPGVVEVEFHFNMSLTVEASSRQRRRGEPQRKRRRPAKITFRSRRDSRVAAVPFTTAITHDLVWRRITPLGPMQQPAMETICSNYYVDGQIQAIRNH